MDDDDEKKPPVEIVTLTATNKTNNDSQPRVEPPKNDPGICTLCKREVESLFAHVCIMVTGPDGNSFFDHNPPICIKCGGWFVDSGCTRGVCKSVKQK